MDDLRRVLSGDIATVDADAVGLSDAQITRLYAAMLTARARIGGQQISLLVNSEVFDIPELTGT